MELGGQTPQNLRTLDGAILLHGSRANGTIGRTAPRWYRTRVMPTPSI
ncbi:MAG TPA: hypothetical protein IGS17_06425 [Oscillatoriales cyanobacterium M59_W2019_021]|nr:hypothetical protein [Oscillatoriales cyanobacterium M4454_W2019_049]HIK50548.1 hypothetical protein [Oscillatoriales cyanobacterium M59_W2019_021]